MRRESPLNCQNAAMPLKAPVVKKVIVKSSGKIALAKKSASAIETGLSVRRFEKRVARTAIEAAKRAPTTRGGIR